ncbi:patatin-like phospholipase family protein [Haloarcula sp. 1CSR25-25]|uniref:patatin-like phospholipase family protein n=1 Tax=Haloarcula sp. 1CSR25-25 TaxID=2862545 RepID=UPI002893D224|nr:patatin-like phospholipase family protein [Haloarcula sp. 1CSR25-25]MDT3436512.1 patatin-like phospholipase family protein [Haloarcula sp. 1CSR25-25]
MSDDPTKVAIACQGGGSHTAFTAGALQRLLPEICKAGYDIVGFSGTSGGAVCALLGWYGTVSPDHAPSALLGEFWNDLKAHQPAERYLNDLAVGTAELRTMGVPFPQFSPGQTPAGIIGQRQFRRLLEDHVDFEHARELSTVLRERERREGLIHPALLISAIDVLNGEFRVFRGREMCAEAILASAAEPGLFGAIEIDGRQYWDGLFSKNPPVRDFSTTDDIPDPDEVWVIQINPSERSKVPRSLHDIEDRRNELSGNTSLEQEVAFIKQVNEWVDAGYLPDRYTHTDIERVQFDEELRWSTKLDRSPAFIEALFRTGRERADRFLTERRE